MNIKALMIGLTARTHKLFYEPPAFFTSSDVNLQAGSKVFIYAAGNL